MKFRKRPVVVEAEQWFPGRTIKGVSMKLCDLPPTAAEWPCGVGEHPVIETLEGELHVSSGDWIITGVRGERYPCKPDIFAATYEPAQCDACQRGKHSLCHAVGDRCICEGA